MRLGYVVFLLLPFLILTSCNFRLDFPKFAQIQTAPINLLTNDSAICGGYITNNGSSGIKYYGVCWDSSPNPTIALPTKTNNGSSGSSFISILTALNYKATYYVRAYVVNGVGISYGNQVVFSKSDGSIPTISTNSITNNLGNTVTCGGDITNDGGWNITARGVCWAYGHNPTLDSSDGFTNEGGGSGQFTSNVNGINPKKGVNIYICAYASNQVGTSYGNIQVFYPGSQYYLGENYAGGIIFYIDSSGNHGLIASPNDLSTNSVNWGCDTSNIAGSNNANIGSGKANTDSIVSGCQDPGIAAALCKNLLLGGYTDWYLPSELELNAMYYNLKNNNIGSFQGNIYWSSTQANKLSAYFDNFNNGQISSTDKNAYAYVRAIRSF